MVSNPEELLVDIYDRATASVAAETLLTAVGPQLERRLEIAIGQLSQAPAELGPLLDARAKLIEIWRMRKRLKEQVAAGKDAVATFNEMLKGD